MKGIHYIAVTVFTAVIVFFILLMSGVLSEKKESGDVLKGKQVFTAYCVLCHGSNADGKGRLAINKMSPPANLRATLLNREQMKAIIKGGGASVGRSGFMPPWGDELKDEDIENVISYIFSLKSAN